MFKRALTLASIMVMFVLLVATALAEFGTNWTAQFYNTVNLTGSIAAIGSYPTGVNVNWGTGSPVDGATGTILTAVNADGFSARFTSNQTFVDGDYEFFLTFEGGARLYIDGLLILDQFTAQNLTTYSVVRTMTAGNHILVVEYFDPATPDTTGAVLQVQWFLGGGSVPTPTTAPIATATVHTVRGLAVRTGPYLGASMITIARPNNTYPVHALNRSEGLFTWYLITINGRQGWASGRYLTVTGNTAVIPEQGTIFDQIDAAPNIGITGQPRAIMNFRVRPSVRVARISQIPWGATVEIIGRTVQGGRNFWLHVRYNGQVGWIYAPFVTINGPIDAVPVR